MSRTETRESGRSGARELRVWDPLVRLIHWSVALAVLINSFSNGEKAFHAWVGYAAVGLVSIRLLWGLVGPQPARLTSFPPDPGAAIAHLRAMLRGGRKIHLSHNPLGALMTYNLWATIAVLAVTGYMMGTVRFFGVSGVLVAHEIAYNWLILSVVIHLGGVFLDSWRTKVPLIRAMITGRKRIPKGAEVE